MFALRAGGPILMEGEKVAKRVGEIEGLLGAGG